MSTSHKQPSTSRESSGYLNEFDNFGGLDIYHQSHQHHDENVFLPTLELLPPPSLGLEEDWDYLGEIHRPRAESTLSNLGIASLLEGRSRSDSQQSFTSWLGGSVGDATEVAAAAFAAASALHSTGLLEDLTAAAAAIDLPPSPEFGPAPIEPYIEERFLLEPSLALDQTDFTPLERLHDKTPIINNTTRKRARSSSLDLAIPGNDLACCDPSTPNILNKVIKIKQENNTVDSQPSSYEILERKAPTNLSKVKQENIMDESQPTSCEHMAPLDMVSSSETMTAVQAVSSSLILGQSQPKNLNVTVIDLSDDTAEANASAVKNEITVKSPPSYQDTSAVQQQNGQHTTPRAAIPIIPFTIVPMSTFPPTISQAGVLAALLVQDELLQQSKMKKRVAFKPPMRSTLKPPSTTCASLVTDQKASPIQPAPKDAVKRMSTSSTHLAGTSNQFATQGKFENKAPPVVSTVTVVVSEVPVVVSKVPVGVSSPTANPATSSIATPSVNVAHCVSTESSDNLTITSSDRMNSDVEESSSTSELKLSTPIDSQSSIPIVVNSSNVQAKKLVQEPTTLESVQNIQTLSATPELAKPEPVGSSSQSLPSTQPCSNYGNTPSTRPVRGTGNRKWDEMLDCLQDYVRDKQMQTPAGKTFVWDGHVPTNYKTADGRALGRWVNNQRSAKAKGMLRKDREDRLIAAGLKWSVLATSTWSDMIRELKVYISEHSKDGESWNGNVPTNYKIKSNMAADGSEMDEEKNLGRWVNRQRSLYHAGRLKKDRQKELEAIGLKWSVLATASWEVMFEGLCEYRETKIKENPDNGWDGDVPLNIRSNETIQKSLGRWVARQRSAFEKNNLRADRVEKLEKIGLKWKSEQEGSITPDS